MVKDFNNEKKIDQSRKHFEAASLLLRAAFFKEATAMYWWSVRDYLFSWLEKNGIPFDSTQTALVAALSTPDLEDIRANLYFAYTIGTMAEWDENFSPTSEQARQYKRVCEALNFHLNS